MKIKNTEHETRHPWPEDMFIQGGERGLVITGTGKPNYTTAFVEASPRGTFLRGEGATIAEAEDACWAMYQKVTACDGSGEHGPYEARGYENGSGFCVKCGAWFVNVLEPSLAVQIERVACQRVKARWGEDVVLTEKWSGLVADEEARLMAEIWGLAEGDAGYPVATTADPTPEELRRPTPEEMAESMQALIEALGKPEGED